MSSSTLIPVGQYLSTNYRPDREYVDGQIQERNVGEKDHSKLQIFVGAYLFNRANKWGIHVYPEQRLQVAPTRFRIPDLCVVAGDEPQEQIFTSPPFLCIEILSKDDTMADMQDRIDDYLRFGVHYVWVLNPRNRKAYVYSGNQMREVVDGLLRTDKPEIEVPLEEIFGALD